MVKIPKIRYKISEVAADWGCDESTIFALAAHGKLTLMHKVAGQWFDLATGFASQLEEHPIVHLELQLIPTECGSVFLQHVERAEVYLLADERERFEREHRGKPVQATVDNNLDNISTRECENLYVTIGGLVLMVIELQKGVKFGTPNKPNAAELTREINRVLEAVGASTQGQSKSNLTPKLLKGVRRALGF